MRLTHEVKNVQTSSPLFHCKSSPQFYWSLQGPWNWVLDWQQDKRVPDKLGIKRKLLGKGSKGNDSIIQKVFKLSSWLPTVQLPPSCSHLFGVELILSEFILLWSVIVVLGGEGEVWWFQQVAPSDGQNCTPVLWSAVKTNKLFTVHSGQSGVARIGSAVLRCMSVLWKIVLSAFWVALMPEIHIRVCVRIILKCCIKLMQLWYIWVKPTRLSCIHSQK